MTNTSFAKYSTERLGRHPLHALLAPFPVVCFVGALVTDLTYWRDPDVMWETFSIWLITAGCFMGTLTTIAGIIDFGGNRTLRSDGVAWVHAIGNLVALGLSVVNALVHSRDGYTAVVPQGLMLSGAVVLVLIVTGFVGQSLAHRRQAGS